MTEIERLQMQLEHLKAQKFGIGSSPSDIGYWLLEIGALNLAIAELMLKHE